MNNLYQSHIRQEIQQKVYKRPCLTLDIFGKSYFCIEKTKSIGPFSFKRIQAMGVYMPDDDDTIINSIQEIHTKYRGDLSTIFLQIGAINHLTTIDTPLILSDQKIEIIRKTRLELGLWCKKLGLHTTSRENMPNATIINDLQKSDASMIANMTNQTQRLIRKAEKSNIICEEIHTQNDCDSFFDERQKVAKSKGFSTISKQNFDDLFTYINTKKCGHFYVARSGEKIIAGTICITVDDTMYYLYGFGTRAEGLRNIGGHHYIMRYAMTSAKKMGLRYFDLFGAGPTGFPSHPLTQVGDFKAGFGGKKIECYGSYDIPLHKFLYTLFTLRNRIAKR